MQTAKKLQPWKKLKEDSILFKVQEESLNLRVHSKKPQREYLIY